MPSPIDMIKNALYDLGVMGAAQADPHGEDTTLALRHYNTMINTLAADQLFGWYTRTQAFTFTTSAQSYSLGVTGSGADFIIAGGVRPARIDRAKLVLTAGSPDTETELPVIHVAEYASIPSPAMSSSLPSRIYYQPTFPNGTLWPVPYPTVTSNQLRLYWRNQLGAVAIADIATNIDLPPAYEDFITAKLMKRLAIPFSKTVTDDMKELYRAAEMAVMALNGSDPVLIGTDLYGGGQGSSKAAFISRDY